MAEDYPENLVVAAEFLKIAKNKLVSIELDEEQNNLALSLPIPKRLVKVIKNVRQVLNGKTVEAHSGGKNEYEFTLRLATSLGGHADLIVDIGRENTCKICQETVDGSDDDYLEHLE